MMYLRLFVSLLVAILFLALGDSHIAQAKTCNQRWGFICCVKGDGTGLEIPKDDFEIPKDDFEIPNNDFEIPKDDKLPKLEKDLPKKHIPQSKIAKPEVNMGKLIQIGINIAKGTATVDNYFLFAYANAVDENFTEAGNRYSQALKLAVKNNDIEGQAIASNNLGELHVKMGNLEEATSQLTLAREMYQSLGNDERVGEVDKRLVKIQKLLQVNPSERDLYQFPIQLDPSRIKFPR
ncbi:MAG: tetratricopeptide repeat protein [Symploca sp. SIO1C2]|nr:tetratricopeptide repeat protein [Symploca sp. SIO1C2]